MVIWLYMYKQQYFTARNWLHRFLDILSEICFAFFVIRENVFLDEVSQILKFTSPLVYNSLALSSKHVKIDVHVLSTGPYPGGVQGVWTNPPTAAEGLVFSLSKTAS